MKKTTIILFILLLMTGSPLVYANGTKKNIIDTATDAGGFTTLLAAIDAAGLTDTLKTPGPFTVFAPTDDAFNKLPEGTVEALLEDIPALTDILLYHVVSGKYMASDVITKDYLLSLQGCPLKIKICCDKVYIDGAQIILTDIECTNGVIHVIDTVMIPDCPPGFVVPEIPFGILGSLIAFMAALVLAKTNKLNSTPTRALTM